MTDNDDGLINWYESKAMKKYIKKQDDYPYENTCIKVNSRVLVCGTTGSGKTCALVSYIHKSPNTFSHIIIHTKEQEPLYEMLADKLKGHVEIHYNELGKLPTLKKLREDMEDDERVLLVLDDYMGELGKTNKYPNVVDYLTYGRKKNITLFMLSQGYYEINKTLRNQMTYVLLFTLPQQNDVNAILRQFDTKDKVLQDLYNDATSKDLSFLKINTQKCDPNEKFSRGFTNFYKIKN
jgi:GTPase SAR1 family protein